VFAEDARAPLRLAHADIKKPDARWGVRLKGGEPGVCSADARAAQLLALADG